MTEPTLVQMLRDDRESGDLLVNPQLALAAADRIEELEAALREVVERWDTPLWKDVEPTAAVIARARAALEGKDGD